MATAASARVGERELIMVARTDSLWGPAGPPAAALAPGHADVSDAGIASALQKYSASVRPLFPAGPQAGQPELPGVAAPAPDHPAARAYHRLIADDATLDDIAHALRQVAAVEAAYVKPPAEPAINDMQATAAAPAA